MSFSLELYKREAINLGRSAMFIEVTSNYAENLIKNNYPVVFSLEHLAMLMGVQSSFIRNLIADGKDYDPDRPYKIFRYNYFKLKKRSGGFREIMVPSKDLKFIQKWILRNILDHYSLHDSCTGFRKGFSIYDNAKPHEGADLILKIDLLKFYDTISEKQVFQIFANMGYAKNLAISLAKLVTSKHRPQYWKGIGKVDLKKMGYENYIPPVLPQGAPTSPMLANIRANRLDVRISQLSNKMGFAYTRYADDLTFSVSGDQNLPGLKLIKKIIEDEGFYLNDQKVRYLRKGSKQYVTGLTTTNGVNVSKKYRKEIGTHVHFCRKFGVKQHLKNISKKGIISGGVLSFHDWLYGHICFIQSINKTAGMRLLKDFKKIDWL